MKVLLLFVVFVSGQRIPNYKEAGKAFVLQYYTVFDSPQRPSVKDFFESNDSILVSGGDIFYGVDAIMPKFATSAIVAQRNITASDCQPTNDAGIIVNVFGRILYNDTAIVGLTPTGNSTSIWFHEMFVLKPRVTSFFIQNQHFRASVWNMTSASMNYSEGLRFV